jgi:hypothetical protein
LSSENSKENFFYKYFCMAKKKIIFNKKQKSVLNKYEKNIKTPKRLSDIEIGRIYHMEYRHAKVALYWDVTPASLIISKDNRYVLGLSLHYLPPKTRKFFLQKIILQNKNRLAKNQPVNLPYKDIKNAANLWYREGYAIIRKYIRKRLTGMMEIPWQQWGQLWTMEHGFGNFTGKIKGEPATFEKVYEITKRDIRKAYGQKEVKPEKPKLTNAAQKHKEQIKKQIQAQKDRFKTKVYKPVKRKK